MVSQQDAFVQQYIQELQDLTFNSKPIINTLTMLASENRISAPGIAEAIARHIHRCPPPYKLPALYLLDSIVKNVGLPYTALFAKDIPEVYMAVWSMSPESRPSLQRLLGTWQKLFPQDVLARVGRLLNEAQIAPGPSERPYSQHSVSSNQHPGLPAMHGGYQQHTLQAGGFPGSQQSVSSFSSYGGPSYASANAQPYSDPSLPPPPSPSQRQYAAAYTPTYPQPQAAVGHIPSPQRYEQAVNQQAAYPGSQNPGNSTALPAFLSQLLNSGLIGGAGVPNQLLANTTTLRLSFNGDLKEGLPAALEKLTAGSESSRPKFLDQRLLKKRKLASGVAASRQWYVKESDWLAGTTASTEAVPAFFDEPQEKQEEEEETSVIADPDQPTCALSGERFESFWDDGKNEWRFQGAVALSEEQAERFGLKAGQLVKLSCLAPTVSSGVKIAADSLQIAADQEAAEQIAEIDVDASGRTASDAKEDQPSLSSQKHGAEELVNDEAKRVKTS